MTENTDIIKFYKLHLKHCFRNNIHLVKLKKNIFVHLQCDVCTANYFEPIHWHLKYTNIKVNEV
jgi:hypothetical protein